MGNKVKNENENKSRTVYKDFSEMMEKMGGLTFEEMEKLSFKDPELNAKFQKELEDDGEYGNIFACHDNNALVRAIAEEFDLQIITYSIEDCDSDEDQNEDDQEDSEDEDDHGGQGAFYHTGMHFVNREKYYFCRSKEQGECFEEF